MRKIDEKILEMRIRQSNRKWITKEILLCVIALVIGYFILTSR